MSWLLYAIAPARDVAGTGLDGHALDAVNHRELTAIVSRTSAPTRARGEPAGRLWEYERVVETLAARDAILPARFGSVLPSTDDVVALLRERYEELTARLASVRGGVELAVQARVGGENHTARSTTGTAYILARADEHRRAEAVARALAPLDGLARAAKTRLLPRRHVLVAKACLVDAGSVPEFTFRLAELDQTLETQAVAARLTCTGPWPPYSFAEGVPV